MKFEEAYEKFLVFSESNGTNDGLSTDKGRFVIWYNTAQNKVQEWLIESNGTDENRYLQKVKIPYKILAVGESSLSNTSFKLPSNFFDFIDLEVRGTKEKCKNILFRASEIKETSLNLLLTDQNSKPSFKYTETLYIIGDDKITVYKDNFEVSAALSYYRYPKQIALTNPDNPESDFIQGEVEFDDKLTNRILFLATALSGLSESDPKYQAFKSETVSKF
jgi:hypothetical protein